MKEYFRKFAHAASNAAGSAQAFGLATALIVIWAAVGPRFQYSEVWQLVINTSTTIITFLMVFLIQNSQNRDSKAIHLKLNELLKGVEGARDKLINLEELSDDELEAMHAEFKGVHDRITQAVNKRAGAKS